MINNKFLLILLVLLATWRLGMALYEEKKKRVVFLLFVVVIYLMNTFLGGQSEVNQIFAKQPYELTWLSCVVMPMVLTHCLEWMKAVQVGKVSHKLRRVCEILILLVAGQCLNEKGGFYIILMLLLTVAVIVVRKGYAYVITSGSFKKRV
ncbi:MAG: hypothetical protein IKW08_01790 [Roseburia sp.]|nr:hypothetical protein [Roseburia sp.]